MKAKALSVRECTWLAEECHLEDEPPEDSQRRASGANLCLPNIFRSRKVKPSANKNQSGPSSQQVYHTARELLLQVLNRGAVKELVRRAATAATAASGGAAKTRAHNRPTYSQSREHSAHLSEGEYSEALTWFSIVLQSGLYVEENCSLKSVLTPTLDGWQGVLKRNSFQTNLLSLSRLEEDGDKLDALSAFCGHLTGSYRALYTPGQQLAVKKYRLSYEDAPDCSLHLALLCDMASGFICNMYLYCPERLQRQSRRPVVEQVVGHLLRPFGSGGHVIQLDSSAQIEGKLAGIFSGSGVTVHFVPTSTRSVDDATSESSSPPTKLHRTSEDSHFHLQGWTGPALFPLSDLKGSAAAAAAADVFLPGLWATLHVVCINTFTLHTLQCRGSARQQVRLTEFTRTVASQLAADRRGVTVPVLPRLNSTAYQETSVTSLSKQRTNTISCAQEVEIQKQACAVPLQMWSTPGVCGLDNSGNSCYLNAVLQCLCSTVPLVEHLLCHDTRKELARSKCRVAEVFVRLLQEMWLGRSSRCAPLEARSVLCSILPQFNNYSQQDAQELLLFLLNVLHDDLKKVAKCQMRSSVRQPRPEPNGDCLSAERDATMVTHLFEGQLSYMTLCMHCDHQGQSTQTFTVLSLPIPTVLIKCSIQDCLSLFFEQTILTGGEQMLCSSCGLRRETAVLTCLDKPPEILMLHLKRFGCKGKNQVKLKTNVVFPMKLDLTKFLPSSLQNTPYASYRLYAVVNHKGHLHMGHYTALCHNSLIRTWHCFDDSEVREVQSSLVQSPNAYMLLYSRKPFHKPKIHGLCKEQAD